VKLAKPCFSRLFKC